MVLIYKYGGANWNDGITAEAISANTGNDNTTKSIVIRNITSNGFSKASSVS